MKIIVEKRYGFHAICIKLRSRGERERFRGNRRNNDNDDHSYNNYKNYNKKTMITKTKSEIFFQIRSERKKMAGESAHSRPESSSSQADEERDLPHVSEEKYKI